MLNSYSCYLNTMYIQFDPQQTKNASNSKYTKKPLRFLPHKNCEILNTQ